jgi:hypothetical protein
VYETKIGKGKLLVCTLDLNRDLAQRPVARQLRQSLLQYAASPAFNPTTEIPLDGNLPEFSRESTLARLTPKMSASTEHENFWAINAADNNPDTYWHSNWNPPEPALPHSLVIELKQPFTAGAFLYTPRTDCDHGRIARYRIHASSDGRSWNPITEGIFENSDKPQKVSLEKSTTARFFKFIGDQSAGRAPLSTSTRSSASTRSHSVDAALDGVARWERTPVPSAHSALAGNRWWRACHVGQAPSRESWTVVCC